MAASPGARSGSRAPTRSPTSRRQFQFTDVDLQSCASELFGISKLSGRGNLNVSLVASGSSPFGLAQSLDGTATLTGHDGAIAGFNVEQLLKRLERRPLSGARQFPQRLDALRQPDHRGEIQRRHRHRRGCPGRRPRRAPDPDRHRLGAGARIRPQGHRQPDRRAPDAPPGFRAAVRGAGPVGRSADLSRSGKPDPPARRPPRRCSTRSRTARPATRCARCSSVLPAAAPNRPPPPTPPRRRAHRRRSAKRSSLGPTRPGRRRGTWVAGFGDRRLNQFCSAARGRIQKGSNAAGLPESATAAIPPGTLACSLDEAGDLPRAGAWRVQPGAARAAAPLPLQAARGERALSRRRSHHPAFPRIDRRGRYSATLHGVVFDILPVAHGCRLCGAARRAPRRVRDRMAFPGSGAARRPCGVVRC